MNRSGAHSGQGLTKWVGEKIRRPRLVVLSGFMPYYEPHLPSGERQRLHDWCASIAERFETIAEVTFPGLIDSEDKGFSVGAQIAAEGADAILIVNPFPAPAGFMWEALRQSPRTPVVIWAAYKTQSLGPDYDSVQHLLSSGNVGVAMIGNLLARAGRNPRVIAGHGEDETAFAAVRDALTAALVAGRVSAARIAVCGQPLPGYMNVTCDAAALAADVGTTLVDVSSEEFTDAFLSVPEDRIAAIASACRPFLVDPTAASELADSARLAAALETICERYDCSAGAYSSHGEYGNLNPRIGLMGAFATSWMTSSGVPFTDTADVITAIAMLVGKLLCGVSQYTELNTIDPGAGAFLCANTGEADFAASRSDDAICLMPTGSVTGKAQRGVSVFFEMGRGPGCVVGFTPVAGGWRLIAMDGDCLGPAPVGLKVPRHLFRPRIACDEAFARWIEAGATHHAAICLDARAAEIVEVARHMRIGAVTVEGGST